VLNSGQSLYVDKSKRSEQPELKSRIKNISQTRVRYRYRHVHVRLKRDGWPVSPKRIYRLYKEMGPVLGNRFPNDV
jgi:putative transposase